VSDHLSDGPIDELVMVGERSGLAYYRIRPDWAAEIAALERMSYPTADPTDLYDEPSVRLLAEDFPEGCFAGFDGDSLVAMGVGVRTEFDFDHPQHTVSDIVPNDLSSSGHDPTGRWYYGTGIATHPDHRRRGVGSELYVLRKRVCRELNLAGIVAGGVIPGYADHKHEMSADDYIAEVRAGRLHDPTLSFQLENGFEAPCALANYIEDPAVDSWAALIVWHNPDFDEGREAPR
jgi:GNAT superfamily N-acetyltransferase